MSAEELDRLGVNRSHIHHDFMISDEHTTVRGKTASGEWVTLLEKGHWTDDFK